MMSRNGLRCSSNPCKIKFSFQRFTQAEDPCSPHRREEGVQILENSKMTDAVIVSTARTALTKSWKGAFNMIHGAT